MNTQMTIEYLVSLIAILAVAIGEFALYRATRPTSQTEIDSLKRENEALFQENVMLKQNL
ncbi:hypothetical protein [Lactococcus sp.]|uniref:hypothetical protein n=1 Tax=Lactococcus sp. TaxID=44273 RepID=UPI0035B3F276